MKATSLLLLTGVPDRLADFYIRVGLIFNTTDQASFDPTTYTPGYYQSRALGADETRNFTCDHTIPGRFVTVHFLTNRTEIPNQCEVAVYERKYVLYFLVSFKCRITHLDTMLSN